ncbi:hypothetical protein KK141_14095 [Dyella sp. LX-66]|uniref:hypothetical protein n=1 Tax=unclassified Dyella TaxID=2634549 RepID=UPI001BE0EC1B|nr:MULTISPECIES: hypothetical protein [unclassified Dyella]MBT2116384.1 hypothetical protein [Dyella sp. LX-1]MBT2140673.1 hypothetical protein [Dyella sp. LX-66]
MATKNDTAVYCAKVPPEEFPTSPLGRPFHASDADANFQIRTKNDLAAISMAINVLTGILANSESFRDMQVCNVSAQEGEWPLPPTCVEGVFTAVHYLSRYAESLSYRLDEVNELMEDIAS